MKPIGLEIAQSESGSTMRATISPCIEYGTERPCRIGRIEYKVGLREYVALTFCHTDDDSPWYLTWVGEVGSEPARLEGVFPSPEMLAALAVAPVEEVSVS